ncbi:hypothetical protein FOE78_07600 [Microlunatus elymi]|uniref:Uncharacterized protein n=1 Tax=Microlunatus elymi TaxID=2596828 RepID=A0A516PX78_9ACTN|nr:hypothetical protein [Microlunatus elymi]QDP95779.1 hypothetical protein FOE78_07600 [Microlunatus elymi]
MSLFSNLIDDTVLLDPDPVPVEAALTRHRHLLAGSAADALATLVVEDRTLAAIDRAAAATTDPPIPVTVINTGGAGGLTALAGRSMHQLAISAVDTTLRDPGDLLGNVARVVAAARELDPDIAVHVEIPYGFGWQDAVAEVEAAGLQGLIRMSAPARQVAEQLSAFVEADLGFVADRLPGGRLTGLLLALDALIDGSAVGEAAGLLAADDHDHADTTRSWGEPQVARIRRRLQRVRTAQPELLLERLQHRS